MKKLLLLPSLLVTFTAFAQTPLNVAMPIVQKATATWCGPCGDWGWDLMDQIRQDNNAKAAVFSCYGDEFSKYFSQTSGDLSSWRQTYPNWGVNNINRTAFDLSGSVVATATRNTVKATVDSFAATQPVASTGFTYSINGSLLTVNTKTKFWMQGTGDYYLAAYIIEDSVYGTQQGKTGNVYHRDVLRASMTSSSSYGVPLASGAISINSEYPQTFTYALDPTWDMNRIKVLTVIWKKALSKYAFVNANNKESFGTGVANVDALENFNVYPNPATSVVNISGTLSTTEDIQIRLVNALGQVVYSKKMHAQSNSLSEAINVESLSAGVYMLDISSNQERTSRRIVVSR
jgi:hypothetical protein